MNVVRQLVSLVVALALAVSIIAGLIVWAGGAPGDVWSTMQSTFVKPRNISDMLVVWVSLAICSAGMLVAFRAGQWNIGVEGQITVGAIFAFWMARLVWDAPGPVGIPLIIVAGMFGGALWGLLVGLLKVYGGVNEIFGGIGLNFVATSMTIYLIAGPWRPEGTSSVAATEQLPDALWMPTLEGLRVSPQGIVIAVLVILLLTYILSSTLWGLKLRAVGRNMRGAFILGIRTKRVLLSAYAVCGMCAGITGSLILLTVRHQLVQGISSGYGFLSILIVLLTGTSGLLIFPIALFFAAAGIGGLALQLQEGLDKSLSGVLVGVVVLAYEFVLGVRDEITERLKARTST